MFNRKNTRSRKAYFIDVERTAVALVLQALEGRCRDNRTLLSRDDEPFFAADVAHELAHVLALWEVRIHGKKEALVDARNAIAKLATKEPQ